MHLIELRANKDSFHPITFNKKGISIIAAIKETEDQRKTYNSVGKSLAITLIHFCLGSNSIIEFEEKLKDWEFTLEFTIDENKFIATRSTSKQDTIVLNAEKLTLEEYKNKLENLLFRLPSEKKFISYRGLISRFIRPFKFSYISYDLPIKNEDKAPVIPLINNSFLLGLNIDLVLKKKELKDKIDSIKNLKKQLENPEFKSLFEEEDKDFEIKIVELENTINALRNNLDNFKIADDYDQIRINADGVSQELRSAKNHSTRFKTTINNIEKSLDIRPDIKKEKITDLYNEAGIYFSDLVSKRLEDIENFNQKIISNRAQRLLSEKSDFEKKLYDINQEIKKLGKREDELLQYLDTHGALEEYTQLNKQLSDQEKRLEKLNQYKKLLAEYKIKEEETKQEFSNQNISANKYLEEATPIIRNNIRLFQSFSEKFYSSKSTGISVENNEGVNSIRFNIKAKIEDDAGDAVNEVKIYCFDWTLLKAQHGHKINFIFHDSRITDGMDTRQIKTMFDIANEECDQNDFQYIISLNQNVIDNLKTEMSSEQHKKIISDNIILSLSDKSPKDKLLGIQIDLDYGS